MSSITITPSYASTLSSTNTNNNNNYINVPRYVPPHLSSNTFTHNNPPNYLSLRPQIPQKPSLYGAGQRKYNNYHKFQTGTTTTFSGYTNVNSRHHNNNFTPIPPSRQYHNYNNNNHYNNNNNNNRNHYNAPSLMNHNNNNHHYQTPSRHNTRSYYNAQTYHPQNQHYSRPLSSHSRFNVLSRLPSRSPSPHRIFPPSIKPRRHYHNHNNYNYNNNNKQHDNKNKHINVNVKQNNNVLKGFIISDSMCSRVRTYAINKLNLYNVQLSYESGCDSITMINWLKTPDAQSKVGCTDFLLISLGTNDVGRYGVDVSIQRCSELISFIRQSYRGIRVIGWLALSPRWKPTRFVSAAEIGDLHCQFNERLHILSKQLDFDFVDARLGPSDMRVEDRLHPSATTGKWKYEGAIREWFTTHAVLLQSSSFRYNNNHHHSSNNNNNNYNNTQQHHHNIRQVINHNNSSSPFRYHHHSSNNNNNNNYNDKQQNHNNRQVVNHNSTQPFIVTTDSSNQNCNNNVHPNIPSRALINIYPHQLRTIDQFFRNNEIPKEVEKDKNKIFLIANYYYQSRYFQEENKKWKIYEQVASNQKDKNLNPKDGDDILMVDDNEIEIEIARPYRERHSKILNTTITSENESDSQHSSNNSNEASRSYSASDEEDNKKRKLRKTSLSPSSIIEIQNNNNEKETNNIRKNKKKDKSRKKKKIPIEHDPRAPEGSPIALVNEINERTDTVQSSKRQDTPISPTAKRQRLFSHKYRKTNG
ncbi:unnamed protein product [Adineta steineri]|uniref:Uncharacterized protein n=1 Tax=Adineta steineri TaxID=433720 RepID=A0A819MR16_9BILA|nr:unnamed protein product [Adineta steineri]CAF3983720.1 unnamed protein product [Adineta steineri]